MLKDCHLLCHSVSRICRNSNPTHFTHSSRQLSVRVNMHIYVKVFLQCTTVVFTLHTDCTVVKLCWTTSQTVIWVPAL